YMVPLTMFTTYGVVTEITGGRTASAYLVTLAAMLFTAFSYSFMVKKYPIAGSAYSYTSLSFGPCVGFLAGWSLLLDYLFLPMINYLLIGLFLNIAFPMVPAWVFVLAAIGLVTVLNVIGISSVAGMSNVIVGAQFVFAVVFVAMAVKHLAGIPSLDLSLPFVGDGSQPGFAPLMAGAAVLCLSFLGFDAISTLAEEVKGDPARQIGRAALIALFIMGGIFIAQTWLATDLAAGMNFKSADTAFYEIAEAAGGQWLSMLTAVATALAWGVTVSITSQAAVSRLLYSMARDGRLPRALARVHPRYQTPHVSLYLVAVLSLGIGWAFLDAPDVLTSLVNFGALTGFCLLHLSVINHYYRRQRSGQWLRHLLFPLVGLAIIAYVLYSMSLDAQLLGLAWIAVGLVYLALLQRGGRQAPTELAKDL
ncbi:MAG: APC family permease, partial [Pseudomonas aeruginosa]|nr:APC family permease [Pseudomonas aeruginosa]